MRVRSHAPAIALFVLLSLALSFPLVLHLGTHVPGTGPGDNLSFVWNLWWMRTAIQGHLNPLYTTYLFHPVGVDLAQHTHTALNGLVAATVLAPLPVVAAQDVLLLLSLFANGFLAYLLAFRLSGDHYAATAAGIVFGGAAPILVRLSGHFNLVGAWVIPLAALMFLRASRSSSRAAWLLPGGALVVAAYTDYYYLVYTLALLAICVGVRWMDVRVVVARRRRGAWEACVLALVLADLVLIVAIAVSGGFMLRAGGLRISLFSTLNARIAFWLLLAGWALARWRVSLRAARRPTSDVGNDVRGLAVMLSAFLLGVLPLAVATARLLYAHDYTSQRYSWHSAPPGVDLASFLVGNPTNLFYGSWTRWIYSRIGISPIEGVAWITPVALVIVFMRWRRLREVADARAWRVAAVVFGVWALGPHLDVFGTVPGILLPASLVQFVPFVANARMPGRATVVVVLAVAMLLAIALGQAAAAWSRRRKGLVLALLLLDVAAAPIALYRPPENRVYAILREQPGSGAVLELPLGLRDGLGETGAFDARTLFFQTISGRPMLGGFVARLPERVKGWYRQDAAVSVALTLSDRTAPPPSLPIVMPPERVYESLRAAGVTHVVLDRALAGPRLRELVASWPLVHVFTDSDRELYALRKPANPYSGVRRP